MADTDTYQADNSQIDNAMSKTAQAADAQKAKNAAGAEAAQKGGQDATDAKQMRTQKTGAKQAAQASYKPGMAEPAAGSVATVLGGAKKGMDKVPETGAYGLTKGEMVLPASRASEYRKVFKSRGDAGQHKWGGK